MSATEFAEAYPRINKSWVIGFLTAHSISLWDFYGEFGVHDTYDTDAVLAWAGY